METLFVILAIVGILVGATVIFGIFKDSPKPKDNESIQPSPNPQPTTILEPVEPVPPHPIRTLPSDLELEPITPVVQDIPKMQAKKKRKQYKPRKPKIQ